jgi:hypothetical protein
MALVKKMGPITLLLIEQCEWIMNEVLSPYLHLNENIFL